MVYVPASYVSLLESKQLETSWEKNPTSSILCTTSSIYSLATLQNIFNLLIRRDLSGLHHCHHPPPQKKKNMSFWRRQQIVYIYQGNVHDLFSAVSACVPASSKWPFDSPIGGHQQALKRSLKTTPKGHTEEPCVYHRYIDDQQLPRMDAKQNMTMEEKNATIWVDVSPLIRKVLFKPVTIQSC